MPECPRVGLFEVRPLSLYYWPMLRAQMIQLFRDSSQGAAFEFLPGKFKGKFWNAGSVCLEEEVFLLISKPFASHVPNLDFFGITDIQRSVWERIIEDLDSLAIRLLKAKNLSELDGALVFYRSVVGYSTDEEEFQKDFAVNAKAVVTVIGELIAWLREILRTNESISILGV